MFEPKNKPSGMEWRKLFSYSKSTAIQSLESKNSGKSVKYNGLRLPYFEFKLEPFKFMDKNI